jgi:hypothetical protein
VEHAGRDALQASVDARTEVAVEQDHPVAQDHGHDVEVELVQQARGRHLTDQAAAPGDHDVVVPGSGAGPLDGGHDPVADVGEARSPPRIRVSRGRRA